MLKKSQLLGAIIFVLNNCRLAEEMEQKKQKKHKKIDKSEFVLDKIKAEADIKQKDRFHSVLHLPTYIENQKEVTFVLLWGFLGFIIIIINIIILGSTGSP